MKTINNLDKNNIRLIKKILDKSGLVAFPTETVYGLGANAFDAKACANIYIAKGRPSDNPLIVHVANEKQLLSVVEGVNELEKKLIDKFWPGPLTIIFNKAKDLPYKTTGGLDTVAVRMPSNKIALELIGSTYPLAAPSANTSGKPSPTTAKHVEKDLKEKVDIIIDGGKVDIGIESTIIEVVGEDINILRPGHITKEMLSEFAKNVYIDDYIKDNTAPKAPGMKYKHYAPNADIVLLDMSIDDAIKFIQKQNIDEETTAIIAKDEEMKYIENIFSNVTLFNYGRSVEEAANNLYEILRICDDKNIRKIYSTVYEKNGRGIAFMNRLEKAAAFNTVRSFYEEK